MNLTNSLLSCNAGKTCSWIWDTLSLMRVVCVWHMMHTRDNDPLCLSGHVANLNINWKSFDFREQRMRNLFNSAPQETLVVQVPNFSLSSFILNELHPSFFVPSQKFGALSCWIYRALRFILIKFAVSNQHINNNKLKESVTFKIPFTVLSQTPCLFSKRIEGDRDLKALRRGGC